MALIRMVLVDNQTLFREGMKAVFALQSGLEVVGEAGDGVEAVRRCAESPPDIVLMDIGMAGLSSFEAARQIRKQRPQTRIVFLTMYEDEDYLVAALEVGAAGYVLKDASVSELIGAIREIHQGGSYLSPRMMTQLVNDFRSRVNSSRVMLRSDSLTAREKEVVKLVAEGNSVKEIAWILKLSVKTIEAHKFNLMRKLGIHNKAHLVQYAFQKRIVRLQATA
ncbi:MAG: response regulator transcription factor [Acidobacteriota bacterium]|nr:response regulator transcription factor [Acidobacteriota bacterium]